MDRKRDIFEPSVALKADYKNYLLLSYYRNALIHLFIQEAVVACSIHALDIGAALTTGVPPERVEERSQFLAKMLNHEFVLRLRIQTSKDFEQVVGLMQERGILETREGRLRVRGEVALGFLCSLVWPLVDTYWFTLFYILTLLPAKTVAVTKIYQNVQWYAETLYEERIITFYESASQETIKNALLCFEVRCCLFHQKWGVVERRTVQEEGGGLHYMISERFREERRL